MKNREGTALPLLVTVVIGLFHFFFLAMLAITGGYEEHDGGTSLGI